MNETVEAIRQRNEERRARLCECGACAEQAKDDIEYLLAEVDRMSKVLQW